MKKNKGSIKKEKNSSIAIEKEYYTKLKLIAGIHHRSVKGQLEAIIDYLIKKEIVNKKKT